jgi:NAD(P)-dependent dehydrogenase (short-subunit alcohol dehydrogenase family)
MVNASTCSVIATSRDPGSSQGLQQLAEKFPDRLVTYPMDVTDMKSITACSKAVKERFGHLNLLFNVAAVLHVPGVLSSLLLSLRGVCIRCH